MNDSANTKGTLVTGVIGEDVHIVGIRILEHALRNEGYTVAALGAQTSQEEFINAARETNADAILVSSLSGHCGGCEGKSGLARKNLRISFSRV